MRFRWKLFKMWKLVQRENAARLTLISLLSFIATVTVVRTILALTGYPQLGGGTLHIAHVLWGGLILYIAAVLPLIYLNPRLTTLVAVLSGVGVGLFIDEVGKFITTQYDYFYPAAAPIMYVFFLLLVILVVMINRPDEIDGRAELLQALQIVQEQLYRPLDECEKQRFDKEVGQVMANDPIQMHVDLARFLLDFIHADARTIPETSPSWWLRLKQQLTSWLTEPRLRRLVEAGLFLSGLLALKNPFQVWLELANPKSSLVSILQSLLGRQIRTIDSPTLFNVRLSIEVLVGLILLISAILLYLGKRNRGINLGFFALMVSLTVLDLLLFYFEQFSSVLIVTYHFIVLFGLLDYRRRYLQLKQGKLDIKA